MTLLDQLFLLATGLVAIYMIYRFYSRYKTKKGSYDIYYMLSFAVLLVAGLLLIGFTYNALGSPFVVIVAVLIPAGLALGLVAEFYPKYEKAFLIFAILGLLVVAVTRLTDLGANLATISLIIVHSIAGLTILIVPILAARDGRAPKGFVFVTVGGALIGLGGMALAFLKTGSQLLFFSADFVFTILAPLLFLMSLAFAWGFMKKIKADTSAV
jgi:hypothetical protein